MPEGALHHLLYVMHIATLQVRHIFDVIK